MKKIIIFLALIIAFPWSVALADTSIHLKIETPTRIIYDEDIAVAPCDSDQHGTLKTTPYCAILQLQPGIPSVWDWAWAPGAFVTSIDGVSGFTSEDSNGDNVYHYWSWTLNGAEGMVGLNQYDLQPNDLIALSFVDPVPPAPAPSASYIPDPVFDNTKGFEFLISEQEEDGSFGEDLYTDWVALALVSGDYPEQTLKLTKYFEELKMGNALLTDYERHTMALMALGLNPYEIYPSGETTGQNYIEKIIEQFDGKQFGDPKEDNDDIFALIVLQNAGFTETDKIIKDDINFILSRQHEDGSFDGNVDMTGAAISALSAFSPTPGVGESLKKAKSFLRQTQKSNGGWDDNVSSTAWAWQGLLAQGEKPEDWKKSGNTPLNYLGTMQGPDGGTKDENLKNKIWKTAYVVSVLSGKNWNQVMRKFDKPIESKVSSEETSKKTPLKKPRLETPAEQNTATAINSTANQNPPIRGNWFMRLLQNIFGFF